MDHTYIICINILAVSILESWFVWGWGILNFKKGFSLQMAMKETQHARFKFRICIFISGLLCSEVLTLL